MQKVHHVDSFNVSKIVKVNIEEIGKSVLQSLDRFLRYLQENRPEILNEFVESLEVLFRNETQHHERISNKFPLEEVKQESVLLSDYDNLFSATLDFTFSNLGLHEKHEFTSHEIEVSAIDRLRATAVPLFFRVRMLTQILNREDAFDLIRNYIESTIELPDEPRYENLEGFRDDDIRSANENENSRMSSILADDKYIVRVDNCMVHEALKEYDDAQLKDLVFCSGDFSRIKIMNPNFALTRTCTLMTGPYCDACVHDSRVVEEFEHPTRGFYDSM